MDVPLTDSKPQRRYTIINASADPMGRWKENSEDKSALSASRDYLEYIAADRSSTSTPLSRSVSNEASNDAKRRSIYLRHLLNGRYIELPQGLQINLVVAVIFCICMLASLTVVTLLGLALAEMYPFQDDERYSTRMYTT